MATFPALISVQDYLGDYLGCETKPMYEYVAGVLVPKGMGTFSHEPVKTKVKIKGDETLQAGEINLVLTDVFA